MKNEHLILAHQVTTQPDLSIMNWMLFNLHQTIKFVMHVNSPSSNENSICVIRPKPTLKVKVSYRKYSKYACSPLLLHCLLCLSQQPLHHGNLLTISWQKKRRLKLFFMIFRPTPNWITVSTKASLWDIVEGQWLREIFPKIIILPMIFVALDWKDRWPDVQLYTDFWAMVNSFVAWSGTLKKHDW
jgi:hypothetical protein